MQAGLLFRAAPPLPTVETPLQNATPTQVFWDVAQVWLNDGRVEGLVVAQQVQIPGIVFKVRLREKRAQRADQPPSNAELDGRYDWEGEGSGVGRLGPASLPHTGYLELL